MNPDKTLTVRLNKQFVGYLEQNKQGKFVFTYDKEVKQPYFILQGENNTIDIYEATIGFYYDESMFPHYSIVEKGLVIEAIDELQKVKI